MRRYHLGNKLKFLFSLTIFPFLSLHAAPKCSFDDAAIELLVSQISPHDARLLLNLFYWSYQRSEQTLLLQEQALRNLNEQWQVWYRCALRRVDAGSSSANLSYGSSMQEVPPGGVEHIAKHCFGGGTQTGQAAFVKEDSHRTFLRAAADFHKTQTTYTFVIDATTKAGSYTAPEAFAFVAAVRSESRRLVLCELWDHFQEIKKELEAQLSGHQELWNHQIPSLLDLAAHHVRSTTPTDKSVSTMLAQHAALAFNHFDKLFMEKSDELFGYCVTMQGLFNKLWERIERVRADYYRILFLKLHTAMRNCHLPAASFCNLFNERGLLKSHEKQIPLRLKGVQS